VYAYRPLTPADAPELCELIARSEQFDGVPRVLELDELVEEMSSSATDLPGRSLVATDSATGAILGFTWVQFRHADAVEQRCHIDGVVDPQHRDQGIGRALVQFAVERSRAVLEAIDDDLPKYIRLATYDYIESAQRLAARMGFTLVRYFEELLRPLTDLPGRERIDGLRLSPWLVDREDDALITKNTAFLDHWGSVPSSSDAWREQLHGYAGRPDLSFVAIDEATDEIVGVLVSGRYPCDDELLGRRDGWIHTLGTLRAWRGRGVGSALIIEALHAYAAAGLTHASLGVDTENPSGAGRLYRALGFERAQRTVIFQIEV
jgi:mycothiol synthase